MTEIEEVINSVLAKMGNGEDLTMEELEVAMTFELTEEDEEDDE